MPTENRIKKKKANRGKWDRNKSTVGHTFNALSHVLAQPLNCVWHGTSTSIVLVLKMTPQTSIPTSSILQVLYLGDDENADLII